MYQLILYAVRYSRVHVCMRQRAGGRGYGSALLGRSGTRLMEIIRPIYNIWETVQKNFFTIDYEGLYDEPFIKTPYGRGDCSGPGPHHFPIPYGVKRLIGF